MAVTSCPGLAVSYLLSPSIIAGGLLMLRLGTMCTLPPAPPRMEERSLGKQRGRCISGGQSGPRIEAESQAKQGQGHASGSQEQLQAQEQE